MCHIVPPRPTTCQCTIAWLRVIARVEERKKRERERTKREQRENKERTKREQRENKERTKREQRENKEIQRENKERTKREQRENKERREREREKASSHPHIFTSAYLRILTSLHASRTLFIYCSTCFMFRKLRPLLVLDLLGVLVTPNQNW